MGFYPDHRNNWPVEWTARAGATIDDPPLPPRRVERTRAIRAVFLHELGGHASILAVGHACYDRGLLDGLTHLSAYESIKVALRPLCVPNGPYGPRW